MRYLTWFVIALLAFGCKKEPPAPTPRPYPHATALEIAVTLAALRDQPDKLDDRQLLERYRIDGKFGLLLLRRWIVGSTPSPTTITPDEIRNIFAKEPPAPGREVSLMARPMSLGVVVAAMLDPGAKIFERTRALTGVTEREIRDQLRDVLKIDLEKRTVAGIAWTDGRHSESPWIATVVDHVTDQNGEITLADAVRLDPQATLGGQLWFPADLPVWIPELPLHPAEALGFTTDSDEFQALRLLGRAVAMPPAIAPALAQPVFQMYREGYGVLYTVVPRDRSMAVWRALDAAAPRSGLRPILFAGDDDDFLHARTWRPAELEQARMHPMDSPQAVLASVDRIDVAALLAPGGNPSYPDEKPRHGAWPTLHRGPRTVLASTEPLDTGDEGASDRRILLVPAIDAWQAIAYVPGFVDSGESTPSLAQVAAVSMRWEKTYGAKLAAIGPATLEWQLTRKLTKPQALAFALELAVFSPEGAEGTVEDLAAEIMLDARVGGWWD